MGKQVLALPRWIWFLSSAIAVLFIGFDLWVLSASADYNYAFVIIGHLILCIILAVVFILLLIRPSLISLTLEESGFRQTLFLSNRYFDWKYCSEFSIHEIHHSGRIMKQAAFDYPGFERSKDGQSAIRLKIPYGIKSERLCKLMNEYREDAIDR